MIINITCPNCNFSRKVSHDKIPEGIKFAKCPRCSNTFELPSIDDHSVVSHKDEEMYPDTDAGTRPDSIASDEYGYFTGLWKTFTGVLFSPSKFFRNARDESGLGNSFAFGWLMGSVGAMFGVFWQFLLESRDISYAVGILSESIPLFETISVNHIFLGLIFLSPFMVLVNILIVTLVLHFFLLILGGANNGFERTFRVTLYSNATSMFNLIPFIGGIIAFFWNCVILVTGLKEIHETSTLRALFSLLLPFFILFILVIVVVILFISLFI